MEIWDLTEWHLKI